ncbi:MAG: YqgE/AlgH family protein [Bacteroidota bacterium]|nr:YqgE/AlgH family protein [Bacteroidota bacterium]
MQDNLNLKKGCILVSKPLVDDGFFEQSIIFLTAHDSKGSLGFALNKKSSLLVRDVMEGFSDVDPIYYGGPVEQEALFYLHSFEGIPGAIKVGTNLFLGGDFEIFKIHYLKQQVNFTGKSRPKFFLGYSGWSEGQLVEELQQDAWLVLDSSKVNYPLNTTSNSWREYMKKLGGKYALWANSPQDPCLN